MHSTLWQEILSDISVKLSPTTFDTWFKPLSLNSQSKADCLSIAAPNQFIADYVEHHFKTLIFSCIKKETP